MQEARTGPSVRELRHMLAVLENEAALALRESTQALIAYGEAWSSYDEGLLTMAHVVAAGEAWKLKLGARLQADARVDFIRKQLRDVTGRAA